MTWIFLLHRRNLLRPLYNAMQLKQQTPSNPKSNITNLTHFVSLRQYF